MSFTSNRNEAGNVLFLILIAVALFAALSYAVTQSTRSGSGSADREQSILSGAQITQYPTGLRTAVIRQILSGTDVSNLAFNAPSQFGSVATSRLVFHPAGGGASYQQAPADVMASGAPGTWYFNGYFDVPGIGISGAGSSGSPGGSDLIAFLPDISASVCTRINTELNIDTTNCTMTDGNVPDLSSSATVADIKKTQTDSTNAFPASTANQGDLQGEGASCTAFTGQSAGCFNDTTSSEYVYYSVILER